MSSDDPDELFKFITMDLEGSLPDFAKRAKEMAANQQQCFDYKPLIGRDNFMYITCLPWISHFLLLKIL
jgi:chloramphenicol O-acetyltransferase